MLLLICFVAPFLQAQAEPRSHPLTAAQISELKVYIHSAWPALTRTQTDCRALSDPKLKTKPVLYLPANMQIPKAVQSLESRCGVRVARLPRAIQTMGDVKPEELHPAGLLYLPNPYVVPGGRFNEMYGWDSYFIIRGLILDDNLDLARQMIENFFFEIEHYGAILNANRTYYFTRSQPPFLTSMIIAYYDAQKEKGRNDRAWLRRAYEYAVRDHDLWTHQPKLAGNTGLSRYFDLGEGPVPEMGDDPTYYADVTAGLLAMRDNEAQSYLGRAENGSRELAGPVFQIDVCPVSNVAHPAPSRAAHCSVPRQVRLSEDYYKGDRAIRESGFDVSFRFGPYGGSTHHYAPVCLNSLLYKAEQDLSQMGEELGRQNESEEWKRQAEKRRQSINRYLWNQQSGMFFDYDFMQDSQSTYDYATSFYPLWAGLATPEQAQAVVRNLKLFEHAGGLAASNRETGVQWDLPYGWAPLELIPIEGMRHYGFAEDADRVAEEFVSDVYDNFKRDHTIREKYNVVTCDAIAGFRGIQNQRCRIRLDQRHGVGAARFKAAECPGSVE